MKSAGSSASRRLRVAHPALAQAVARVEALEVRRLLASTLDAAGLLTADGTGGDDDLRVDLQGGQIVVTLNGSTDGSFDAGDVTALRLNGLGGDDTLRIGANIIGGTLAGGAGNDTLLGGDGDDTLLGGDDNDTLDGKQGADVMAGGDGFDAADYRFDAADHTLSIDGVANEHGGTAEGDNIMLDVERIVGGDGDDFIIGSDAANSITGRLGNDTIFGGRGNDSIDGNEGNDSLVGDEDNDVLTGGPGHDTMRGGAGDDALISNDGEADTLDGGAGNDNAVADQPGDSFTGIEAGVNIPAPEVTVVQGGGGTLTDNFSTVDFGSVQAGQAGPARTFTVRNDGDDVLSVGAVSVPTGFVLVEGLDGPLQPGASDTFTVRVDTTVAGAKSGTISFSNTDADENPFNFTVTANVTAPPPQIPDVAVTGDIGPIADGQTTPINFGQVNQGATAPTLPFVVSNNGTGPLTISQITLPAGFTLVKGLAGSIPAGGSDTFDVRMTTAASGNKGGDVVITSNDPDEDPFNFAIAGTVIVVTPPSPDITVSVNGGPTLVSGVSSVNFGNPVAGAAGPTRTFTIRNDGDAVLNLGAVALPGGFSLVSGPADTTLGVGQTATFTVRLLTTVAGVHSGTVSVASNDPDESPFTFGVNGTVGVATVPQPEVTVAILRKGKYRNVIDDVTSVDFGSVASNVKASKTARTFRVRNDGHALLFLGKVQVPAGFVVLDPLVKSLAPGKSDVFTIAVNPKTGVGVKSGTVSLATNDANENPFSFTVTATVVAPPAARRPEVVVTQAGGAAVTDGSKSAISFGSVQRRTRAPSRTFTVSNAGTAALTIGAMKLPKGFTVVEPLKGPIAPGKHDTFTIALATKSAGSRAGRVSFVTNDANENPFDFAISGAVSAPPVVGGGPAVTAAQSGGTLTVTGTGAIDTIALSSPSRGVVNVVGNDRPVGGSPFSRVTRIVVNGNGGDDRIDASGVAIPVVMSGGLGNDTLIGGGGNDTMDGNDGNDALIGNGGVDVLRGDAGNDSITATDGIADASVDGGAGKDVIRKDRTDRASGT